jgi:integrase
MDGQFSMPRPLQKHGRLKRRFHKLTDKHIDAISEFASDKAIVERRTVLRSGDPGKPIETDAGPRVLWDAKVPGLKLRIGRHRATWTFYREYKKRGERSSIHRVLGYWSPIPGEGLSVSEARKRAVQLAAAKSAKGYNAKAEKLAFKEAFEDYGAYLLRNIELANKAAIDKADKANRAALKFDPDAPLESPVLKEPTWHKIVVGIGKRHLLPQWGHLTLAELSDAPDDVRKWHERLTDGVGAVTANKCVKLVRATYRHAAKNIRGLPPELPTSAVKLNDEDRPDLGMTPAQFRKWADAWRQIESPSRKAYQLLACLTGPRPGELARLRVTDIDFAENRFTIRKAKKSNDILIPISKPIERALRMALKARGDDESDWLFPAREGGHIKRFDSDSLPLWGNGLRHNYKTLATIMQVDEMLRDFLQGHAAKGVARGYVSAMVLAKSAELRAEQERISTRMVSLLGLKETDYAV